MTRFYLEDQTAETAGLTTCDFAAHAMRAEVHDRNLNGNEDFNPLHVCVMDVFIPFAALTINEDKLAVMVQAMFYAPVTLPEVYEAIKFLNKKSYLRKGQRNTGYELAYLDRSTTCRN